MKIKAVCEATGLSDRTIRYYIEEGLLSPHYTENYLGRKTFDFSGKDVMLLKDISVLRRYGFSVVEIRQIVQDSRVSAAMIHAVRQRKQQAITDETLAMAALTRLDNGRDYSLVRFVDGLTSPGVQLALSAMDRDTRRKRRIRALFFRVFLWTLGLLPVVFLFGGFVLSLHTFQYPVFRWSDLFFIVLILFPTLCVLLLYAPKRIKVREKTERAGKWLRGIALCLSVLVIPLSFWLSLFLWTDSVTTSPGNYRRLDALCPANTDGFYQALFPMMPSEDCTYHYRYGQSLFGETYDICAEWTLEQDEFQDEVRRVTELFSAAELEDSAVENSVPEDLSFKTVYMEQGEYTCLIRYQSFDDSPPFDPSHRDYTFYIFAYDPDTFRVRYISCGSTDGHDPYYLELTW